MNRRSVVTELARVLQASEEEVERILRVFAQVLGPVAAEVPPYFERYFESQIRVVTQRIDGLKEHTEQRFQEIERRFQEIERRFDELKEHMERRFQEMQAHNERRFQEIERRFERLERWLFSFMVVLLASILAAVFKLYFGG